MRMFIQKGTQGTPSGRKKIEVPAPCSFKFQKTCVKKIVGRTNRVFCFCWNKCMNKMLQGIKRIFNHIPFQKCITTPTSLTLVFYTVKKHVRPHNSLHLLSCQWFLSLTSKNIYTCSFFS